MRCEALGPRITNDVADEQDPVGRRPEPRWRMAGSVGRVSAGTKDAPSRSSAELEQDLPLLAQRYELSQLRGWSYLPYGLMNPNWQVTADAGVFALKRLVDVSAERAERN